MAKAAKNGKLHRIEQMKEMLRAGLDRADILKKLIKTYKVSIPTMDNELKVAREAIKVEQDAKESILQANLSEQLNAEINASIKSDLELDLILSEIASGGCQIEEFIKGEAVTRNVAPMEQIAAIDKIFRKRGAYANTKVELGGINGKPIETTSTVTLTKEEIVQISKDLEEKI